jgi:membrane fusion protein, multidrug efflux system
MPDTSTTATSMAKKIIITAVALILVIGVLAGIKILQIKTLIGAKYSVPPEAVSTAVVASDTWQQTLTSVGSMTAVQGVTVAAELDGKIVDVSFEAGAWVKAGDVLVRQDTSVEEAQLRSAEAAVHLADVNLKRTKELLEKATVSQAQFDSDEANYEQAVASADNFRALVAKKTIKAPFSGQLGVRLINLGQSLKAGDSIVSLQALNPIFADFYLPQQDFAQLKQGLSVTISGDALPGKTVEGKVTAIQPDVDAATRNVRVQATVDNTAGLLHPGEFMNVAVELPASDKVLPIPATAVLYAPYGDSVYVVETKKDDAGKDQLVVRQQIVRLGVQKGDYVAVTSGLKEGDTIVTSGVFKLRPGSTVVVNNSAAPDSKLAPTPGDS